MERNPILQALEKGEIEKAISFIEEEEFVSITSVKTQSDIFYAAARHGQESIIKLLLSKGCDINGVNSREQTALYSACHSKNIEVIRTLLQNGASINQPTKHGKTPLEAACIHRKGDVVEFLLQNGASLHIKTNQGYTPLSLAAFKNDSQICKLLLQQGASVDESIAGGLTPLMISAQKGHCDAARILLKAKANVDKKDEKGFTSLMLAAQWGHLQFVELLLPHIGSDCINATDNNGFCATMLATHKGHLNIVKLLLCHTNPDLLSIRKRTNILMLAVDGGHTYVVDYLLSIKHGRNLVNQLTCNGDCALHLAAQNGSYEITELLLKNGAMVDCYCGTGHLPLMLASYFGHASVVQLLIENDAQVDLPMARDGTCTALMIAIDQDHLEIVEILLKNGATLTEMAKRMAENKNDVSILEVLKTYEKKALSEEQIAARISPPNVFALQREEKKKDLSDANPDAGDKAEGTNVSSKQHNTVTDKSAVKKRKIAGEGEATATPCQHSHHSLSEDQNSKGVIDLPATGAAESRRFKSESACCPWPKDGSSGNAVSSPTTAACASGTAATEHPPGFTHSASAPGDLEHMSMSHYTLSDLQQLITNLPADHQKNINIINVAFYDQKTVHIKGSQTIGLNQVNIHNNRSKQPATPSSSGERQHSSSSSSDDNGDDNNT
ncbi:ankyrin-1 [Plakobranchus ocellatus]|uniref:Ankyrin-1 n=1 Tax=Plakobranchus ocellatus TaxID=259542 RepID=A0AAV3ZHQ6_9GAST|nr:ankyrin-1 [Plakobranchus ocellatus]